MHGHGNTGSSVPVGKQGDQARLHGPCLTCRPIHDRLSLTAMTKIHRLGHLP